MSADNKVKYRVILRHNNHKFSLVESEKFPAVFPQEGHTVTPNWISKNVRYAIGEEKANAKFVVTDIEHEYDMENGADFEYADFRITVYVEVDDDDEE